MSTPVIINRAGGTASADSEIADKVVAALQSSDIAHDIRMLDGAAIAEACRDAVTAAEPLIIVGGGDGTLGCAAAALAGTKTKLGILPLGTLNHFARDLNIPLDLDGAAAVIAKGDDKLVDIAEMNGRTFINNSAIGLYPLMVRDREVQQKRLGRSKRLAMLVAAVRTLARFNHQRLRLTVNDEPTRVDTPLLFIGNNDYQLELPAAGRRQALDDGKLCLLVMRSKTRRGFVAATLRALIGRARTDDIVRIDSVERVRVDSGLDSLAVSLDGEVLRETPPLRYATRKRALTVRVPSERPK